MRSSLWSLDYAPSKRMDDETRYRRPSKCVILILQARTNSIRKRTIMMTIPMTTAEIVLSLFMTGVLGVLTKFLSLILKPEDDGLLRAVPGILAFFALSAIILLYSTGHPAIATSCLITFMTGYSTVLMTARYARA